MSKKTPKYRGTYYESLILSYVYAIVPLFTPVTLHEKIPFLYILKLFDLSNTKVFTNFGRGQRIKKREVFFYGVFTGSSSFRKEENL